MRALAPALATCPQVALSVLTGAAVALLFAPATGEETRDYIGQRAREGREKVVDAARQFRPAAEPEA